MTREDVYEALVEAEALAAAVARAQNENRKTLAQAYAGAGAERGVAWTPPHDSVRSRLRLGLAAEDEVWRKKKRPGSLPSERAIEAYLARRARPWLTPRARARLTADLAAVRGKTAEPRPSRQVRRLLGAGPWPRLARRAARSRRGAAP